MKNLLLPFVALLIFHFSGLRGVDLMIGVIMMGAPTAVITYVFAYQLKGDPPLASTIVVISTLISVITIIFWIFFMHWVKWIQALRLWSPHPFGKELPRQYQVNIAVSEPVRSPFPP